MKYKIYFTPKEDAQDVQTHISDVNDIGFNSQQLKADNFNIIRVEAMPETESMPSSPPAAIQDSPAEPIQPASINPYQSDSTSAFGRGLMQGGSFGFADEIAGISPFGKDLFSDNAQSQAEAAKNVARAKNELAERGSPVAYSVGEFLGEVPLDIIGSIATKAGGALLAKTGLKAASPTLSKAGAQLATNSVANAATQGALTGALGGMGRAEEGQTLEQGAKGALIGAGTSVLGDVIGKKLMPKSQSALLSESATDAFKSVNPAQIANTASTQQTNMVRDIYKQYAQQGLDSAGKQKIDLQSTLEMLEKRLAGTKGEGREAIFKKMEEARKEIDFIDKLNFEAKANLDKFMAGDGLIDKNVRSMDEIQPAIDAASLTRYLELKKTPGSTPKLLNFFESDQALLKKTAANLRISEDELLRRIELDDVSLKKEMTQDAIDRIGKKLTNLPANLSAPVASSAAQAAQSDRWKLPEPEESMLSPRDYVKKLDADRLDELLRIIEQDKRKK
jgi:hypothetical protein